MGKASISISIDGRWNGGGAITSAVSDLGRLNAAASGSAERMARYLDQSEGRATRLTRLAASTSKSTSKALADSGQGLVEWAGKVWNVGDRLEQVGGMLTKGLTGPVVKAAKAIGETAVSYDTALANVRKVTNMTESELGRLGQSAIELSKVQPVSAETILNVEALGAQFGIADSQLEGFATTVTGLDIATDMNAEQAATELAQFKNIVQMADEDMGRYGSTIVDLGNNFATTESQISQMSLRFASAGKQANLSSADILGFSTAMASMGVKVEMGGSALSQVFVKISKQVATNGENLEAFASTAGMTAEQFREAWRTNASDAFVTLLQGIQDATDAGKDMNVTLGEMGINEIRQSDVMRRLAGNTDLVRSALEHANTAWQDNTALQAEVDQRNESMASRLQVLQNKVDALAITVGVPLVNAVIAAADALEPAFEVAGDVAQAFADMDEDSQRVAIALAGVATAAGPVASGLGGVIKAVAEGAGAIGGFAQDAAVYSDAMNTADGAQMRVYKSSETAASGMGLARNAVAQAAGSVEQYVATWEGWYSSATEVEGKTKTLTKLQEQEAKATGKNKSSIQNKVSALEVEIAAAKASRDANADMLVQWKKTAGMSDEMARSTTTLSGASKAAADTTSTLGGKVKALGGFVGSSIVQMGAQALTMGAVSLAVTAVAGTIGTLIQKHVEAEREQQLLNDATMTFADVSEQAASGAKSQAEGIDGIATSADEALQSLADLNQKAVEQIRDVDSSKATLDEYVSTIERLAGQADLSATDQQTLANAVKGYNEITGDSVEVTNAARGELSKSTEDINKNADAWKRNAEMAAYQQLAIEYTKQHADAVMNLQRAQKKLPEQEKALKDAQDAYNEAVKNGATNQGELLDKANEAGKALQQTKDDVEKYSAAADSASEMVSDLEQANAELAANLEGPLKAAFDALPEGMEGVGINIAAKLAQGVRDGTVDAQAAADFLGSSVTTATETMPDEMQPIGLAAAEALANGVSTGKISVGAATSALEQAAQGNLGALPQAFADAGIDCPQSLADAIAMYGSMPAEKTDEMLSMVALKLTGGDVERAAELLGHDIDSGLADGIRNGTLSEEQAQQLGQDVIDKAKSALDSHSPSKKFEQIGNDVDAGLAQGIQSGQGGVLEAMGSLVQQLLGLFQQGGLSGQMEQSGTLAGNAFASGLGSAGSSVLGSALALSQGVVDGISGAAPSASSEGASAGSGFASGVASGQGASLAAATGLASTMGALSGVPGVAGKYGTGAGSGFSSGVASGQGAASAAASGLAGTMNQLSGVPGTASGYGSRAGQGFASGVSSGVGPTSSAAGRVASAANGMRNTGDSYSWGSHLASNFASGIRSGLGWVASAASAIAQRAASILHFTVPEEGPWSGAERGGFTSGLHLGQNIAEGMRSAVPLVSRAALSLGDASMGAIGQSLPPAQRQVVTNSTTSNVNYYTLNVDGRALQSNPRAQELLGQLVDSLGATAGAGVSY